MAEEASVADAVEDRAARIERSLEEVRAAAGPVAWPRVEALVAELMDLQGAGLRRLLEHALATAERAALVDRLCDDTLLSGLLVLHGLHPLEAHVRVRRALDRLSPGLAAQGATLELVELDERAVTFRATGVTDLAQAAVVRRAAALAAEQVGVELEHIEVVGLPPPPPGELIEPARLVRRVAR